LGMPQNFLACDREQPFLLPPDVREWLPENHLAWFVIDAVGVMDLGGFYAAYRDDGHGRAAYEPSMMVALLLYCWSRGVRSSRAIERACVEDVACRVIAAHQRPDHATIARFVERHERALGELFGEVLVLCADAGLATVGVIAIDGTKVAANANRDRGMDYETIARAIVEEQVASDAADDAVFGERRGDELPELVASRQGREGWLREARQRLEQRRAEQPQPVPRSRPRRLLEGKRRLEEELVVERDAHAQYEAYRACGVMKDGRRFGRPPNPRTPPPVPEGKVNVNVGSADRGRRSAAGSRRCSRAMGRGSPGGRAARGRRGRTDRRPGRGARRHQPGVDAVLQRRAVTNEVQPKARELALAANAGIRQPDLRHRVARRQGGQHARIDPVGLARERRQAP
jgi:transposase